MLKALSLDLRERVLGAVAAGASHRQAGERFGVSAASVSRWRRLAREQGNAKPKALGGDRRSGRIEAQRELILGPLEDRPERTIEELRRALAELGHRFGFGTLHRFFERHGLTRKKDPPRGRAGAARRPDEAGAMARGPGLLGSRALGVHRRRAQRGWASTAMARTHGRAPRGERLRMSVPFGHWKTTTFVAGLTTRGLVAPWVLDGPINRDAFETYLAQVLVPELRPGDIVVMDNLSSHKGPRVQIMIKAAGASLLYLPPYSPDLNPIEMAFAKLKALLRKAQERSIPGL